MIRKLSPSFPWIVGVGMLAAFRLWTDLGMSAAASIGGAAVAVLITAAITFPIAWRNAGSSIGLPGRLVANAALAMAILVAVATGGTLLAMSLKAAVMVVVCVGVFGVIAAIIKTRGGVSPEPALLPDADLGADHQAPSSVAVRQNDAGSSS